MEGKTLYEEIGVAPDATKEEIVAACLRLGDEYKARSVPLWIPYAVQAEAERSEKFKRLEIAYATLTDAESRAKYDAVLAMPSAEELLRTEPPVARSLMRYPEFALSESPTQIVQPSGISSEDKKNVLILIVFIAVVGLAIAAYVKFGWMGALIVICSPFMAMSEWLKGRQEINHAMVCPHCGTIGKVLTKLVQRKKGLSGAKSTAAVITGGVSVFATGLTRKEQETEAHCQHCGNTWHFG